MTTKDVLQTLLPFFTQIITAGFIFVGYFAQQSLNRRGKWIEEFRVLIANFLDASIHNSRNAVIENDKAAFNHLNSILLYLDLAKPSNRALYKCLVNAGHIKGRDGGKIDSTAIASNFTEIIYYSKVIIEEERNMMSIKVFLNLEDPIKTKTYEKFVEDNERKKKSQEPKQV
jgi:hypothetical protein